MNFVLEKTMTNEEKIKAYTGNLLDPKKTNQILADWVKDDNLLEYKGLMKKLNFEKISKQEFATILNQEESYRYKDINPKWFIQYQEMLNEYNQANGKYCSEESLMYCLNFVIAWADEAISNKKSKYKKIIVLENAYKKILGNIAENLINIVSKTLVYEYYNQKGTNFKKFNLDNFESATELKKFFENYPVLAKRITIKTKYLVETYLEALERIDKELEHIKLITSKDMTNIVSEIQGGLGDTHEKAKFVIKFTFSDGSKVIYKPKNLEIERQFYKLVDWINQNSDCEKMPIPHNIYRKDYTIEEMIDYKECSKEAEIERYYKRFGQLVGITYLLNGGDFHHENIIASGEYPYLIDLETIIAQRINRPEKTILEYYSNQKYKDNINNTCFLPINNGLAQNKGKGIDISALSFGRHKLPYKILSLTGDMDHPKFDYVSVDVEEESNNPILNGVKINYINYKKYIIEGFKFISIFVIENKSKVLKKLNLFQNLDVRMLIRNTNQYATMMSYASHPKYTRSERDLEKMFYSLWNIELEDTRFVTSEIRDLLEDDIPLFRSNTSNKNLIDSRKTIIPDYFNTTALEIAKEKIEKYDLIEFHKQLDYLEIALEDSSKIEECTRKKSESVEFNQFSSKKLNKDISDKMLVFISDLILKKGIYRNDDVVWDSLFNGKVELDLSFQRGNIGIYHFLSTLKKEMDLNRSIEINNLFLGEKNIGLLFQTGKQYVSLDVLKYWDSIFKNSENQSALTVKGRILTVIKTDLEKSVYDLKTLIQIIHTLEVLYEKEKTSKIADIIQVAFKALKICVKKEGFSQLDYTKEVNILDYLKINHYFNSIFKPNLEQEEVELIRKINDEWIKKLEKIENWESIESKEYRNILRYINTGIELNMENQEQWIGLLLKMIEKRKLDETIAVVLDVLMNCVVKLNDDKVTKKLDLKMQELEQFYDVTQKLPVKERNYFVDLSMETGISGIGYEILRYKNRSMKSILA